jgi:hypothetical protein
MDLREIRWEGVDWIHLTEDMDQLWPHVNEAFCGEFLDQLSDSKLVKKDPTPWS